MRTQECVSLVTCTASPAHRAGCPLEGADHLARHPAAVEVARLRLYDLAVAGGPGGPAAARRPQPVVPGAPLEVPTTWLVPQPPWKSPGCGCTTSPSTVHRSTRPGYS